MTKRAQHADTTLPHLYYMAGTRSARPRWLLEELEVPYKIVQINMRKGEHLQDAYLAINPLAKVPALTHDGITITESLAICMYLADRFPEKNLAPALNTKDRAHYYKWMAYSIGTFEPAIIEQVRRRAQNDTGSRSLALTDIIVATSMLEQTLSSQKFLLGDKFSAADIMVGSVANWANGSELLSDTPHTLRWLDKLKSRPAYLKSI